jgi:acyl carrier protein
MSEQNKTTIVQTIHEIFQADLGVAIPDNDSEFFEQLHVDSLAFLNAVARLEKTFGIRFVNEELPGLSSCNKLLAAILAHQAERV